MTLQDVVTFSKLSYFLGKLRTELTNTYVSKTTSITGPVYIGVGNSLEEIYVSGNIQTNVFPKTLQVTCSSDHVYVVYPASNAKDVTILMSTLEVPTTKETVTLGGVDCYVFVSKNAYTYTGKLVFTI